jgi:hypothetical protein
MVGVRTPAEATGATVAGLVLTSRGDLLALAVRSRRYAYAARRAAGFSGDMTDLRERRLRGIPVVPRGEAATAADLLEMPRYVEVETSRRCNRSCAWCPNGEHTARRDQELMDWGLFAGLLAELRGLGFPVGWRSQLQRATDQSEAR